HLPRGIARRKERHRDPSRRPRAAAADRDRPSRRGSRRLVGAVGARAALPQYAGLSLDEIAGHGVRWPEHEAAAAQWSDDDAAGAGDDRDGASETDRPRPTEE